MRKRLVRHEREGQRVPAWRGEWGEVTVEDQHAYCEHHTAVATASSSAGPCPYKQQILFLHMYGGVAVCVAVKQNRIGAMLCLELLLALVVEGEES
eukprot:14247-Heterococcus_DN1.PRE.1